MYGDGMFGQTAVVSLGHLSLFAENEPGLHNISPLHLLNPVQLQYKHPLVFYFTHLLYLLKLSVNYKKQ